MALNTSLMATFLDQQNSWHTRDTYQRGITHFCNYMHNAGKTVEDWSNVTLEDAVAFRSHILGLGWKDATAATYWDGINSFYNFLVSAGAIDRSPFAAVKKPKRVIDQHRDIPGDTDVTHILTRSYDLTDNDMINMRNRAMMGVLANGLRVSEVMTLDSTDLFPIEGNIYGLRVTGKGNKERTVPINHDWAYMPLAAYLTRRELWGSNPPYDARPMFVTQNDERVSVRLIQHVFDRALKSSQFRYKKWSPHSFRHNYATRMLRSGVDLPTLQKLLGHANLATTSIYVHLGTEDIVKAAKMDRLGG